MPGPIKATAAGVQSLIVEAKVTAAAQVPRRTAMPAV